MQQIKVGLGLGAPFLDIFPKPIVSKRIPSVSDVGYEKGRLWYDEETEAFYLSGGTVAGQGIWKLIQTGGQTVFPITPYTVGPAGQAAYQTIQAAVNAANAAGGGLVDIQAGSYIENVTFYPNIHVQGAGALITSISGTHTAPTSGYFMISDIRLIASEYVFFNGSEPGTSFIQFINCLFTVSGGHVFFGDAWTGDLEFINCFDFQSIDNGIAFLPQGRIRIFFSSIGTDTTGSHSLTAGIYNNFHQSVIGAKTSLTTDACEFLSTDCTYKKSILISATSIVNSSIGGGSIETGADPAIVIDCAGTLSLTSISISSLYSPYVIFGSGSATITITDLSLLLSSSISPSLNVLYGTNVTGNLETNGGVTTSVTTVTNALSPYVCTVFDDFLACDPTAGAIIVNLGTSPATGRRFTIVDATNQAAVNNITVNGNGNNISFGGTSTATKTISTNGGSLQITFNGTFWNGV